MAEASSSISRLFHIRAPTAGPQKQVATVRASASAAECEKRTRFHPAVAVVTIPSHSSYTDVVKRSVWSTPSEIHQNARRNRREFAAENWNWENVIEEDGMYFDDRSKEHIHPVHLGGIADLR